MYSRDAAHASRWTTSGAGRPVGSGWKPALLNLRGMAHESLAQVLGTASDPLHIVLEAAANPDLDIQVRLGACNIALQYLYPKLSATQVQTHSTVTKVDAGDLLDRINDRIGRLAPTEPETPSLESETVTVGDDATDDAEAA